jgi:prepilin-type N-terminal cleavage/methylation domain-containing protein
MTSPREARLKRTSGGFTLLELVVVLVVLALAAALAVPALSRMPGHRESELKSLVLGSREAAARRGETVYLSISASGSWKMEGAGSATGGPIQSGQVDPFPGVPLTLIVSPVGSCGFDARSAKASSAIRLDPLSCTLLD